MICRNFKSGSQCQLIIRIKGRGMAASAAFTVEYLATGANSGVTEIRIVRSFQRVDVLCQSKHQIVGEPVRDSAPRVRQHMMGPEVSAVATGDECSVAH